MSTNENPEEIATLSVVVIGLNEELNLRAAIDAIFIGKPSEFGIEVIYVDSGSTDSSLEIANSFDRVKVMSLDGPRPSAAKGRNLGIKHTGGKYIQLVDGDSVLQSGWIEKAISFLEEHPDVACVFGQCIEMFPEQSIYMRICGLEWHIPPGETRYCGGNAMWRREVFNTVGFFDDNLLLGEEPDLCYRVRQEGGRIICIDAPMVKHDLGMQTFTQYWGRAENSGKAYLRVALRYWRRSEKLWLYESLRNFIEPIAWLLILVTGLWLFGVLGGIICLLGWWILRATRTAIKVRGRVDHFIDAFLYGLHSQFVRIPIWVGQAKGLLTSK